MCQLAYHIWQPLPEPEEQRRPEGSEEARLLERYLAGDSFARLNLWLQHRHMRRVFSQVEGNFD